MTTNTDPDGDESIKAIQRAGLTCAACQNPIETGESRGPSRFGTIHDACAEGMDELLLGLSAFDRVIVAVGGDEYPGTVAGAQPFSDQHGTAFEAVVELDGLPEGWDTDVLTIGQRYQGGDWNDVMTYNRVTVFDDSPRYTTDETTPESVLAYHEVQIDGWWPSDE